MTKDNVSEVIDEANPVSSPLSDKPGDNDEESKKKDDDEPKIATVHCIPKEFLHSKIPENTDEEKRTKTLRRDLLKLYESEAEADKEEVDRAMIALYRLQTEGHVAYRRLVGTHGGGGGAKNMKILKRGKKGKKGEKREVKYKRIMARKVYLDARQHYNKYRSEGDAIDKDGKWPEKTLHAVEPATYNRQNENPTPFTYAFCWHGRVEFSVWHRPFMREYEMLLQEYDPETWITGKEPEGNKALGAHYWAWEEWDGKELPDMVGRSKYSIQTDKFKNVLGGKFAKGTSIRNPYHSWIAPFSIKEQMEEALPDVSNRPTTRGFDYRHKVDQKFEGWLNSPNEAPRDWDEVKETKHRMKEVVQFAMTEPRFRFFSSTELTGDRSIEHAHNNFHVYLGGIVVDDDGNKYVGTMNTNQSSFDPIFMLHHSNVERLLCGWQRKFLNEANTWKELSEPPKYQGKRWMLPWTKPSQLKKGMSFWNTKAGYENHPYKFTGTLNEWFNAELSYIYEDYVQPPDNYRLPLNPIVAEFKFTKDPGNGELSLVYNNTVVGVTSNLSAINSDCANCKKKSKDGYVLRFPLDSSFSSGAQFSKRVTERKTKLAESKKELQKRKKNILEGKEDLSKEETESDDDDKDYPELSPKELLDLKRHVMKNILKVKKDGKDISDIVLWDQVVCDTAENLDKKAKKRGEEEKEEEEALKIEPEEDSDSDNEDNEGY